MLLALVLAQLSIQAPNPAGPIVTNPATMGSLPLFSAFGPSARGTFGACSTTAPKGAKGETLTHTRASAGSCLTTPAGGFSTTGLADGSLVSLGVNVPRMEFNGAGVLGLFVEFAKNEIILQTARLCNAVWADVGTPNCAGNQGTGPLGTATSALLTDNDGVAFEGRSQFVASVSQTKHTAWCFVKAGTATSATITITGSGDGSVNCSNTITGLSSTTSSIIACTSVGTPSALTGVTVSLTVGTAAADQGTLLVDACNVTPVSLYPSSYIDATAAGATRDADVATFPAPALSTGADFSASWATSGQGIGTACVDSWGISNTTNGIQAYSCFSTGTWLRTVEGANIAESVINNGLLSAPFTNVRSWIEWTASTKTTRGTSNGQAPVSQVNAAVGSAAFGVINFNPGQFIYTDLCFDSNKTRCR